MNGCCFQHCFTMHSHLQRCTTQMITAWGDKTQLLDVEIGAEPGNAADIQRTSRPHKNHDSMNVLSSGWLCDQEIL